MCSVGRAEEQVANLHVPSICVHFFIVLSVV
jgi:hypothetical protein